MRWICERCGSDKVIAKVWVDPNTIRQDTNMMSDEGINGILKSPSSSSNLVSDEWCQDCESHTNIVVEREESFLERFKQMKEMRDRIDERDDSFTDDKIDRTINLIQRQLDLEVDEG